VAFPPLARPPVSGAPPVLEKPPAPLPPCAPPLGSERPPVFGLPPLPGPSPVSPVPQFAKASKAKELAIANGTILIFIALSGGRGDVAVSKGIVAASAVPSINVCHERPVIVRKVGGFFCRFYAFH